MVNLKLWDKSLTLAEAAALWEGLDPGLSREELQKQPAYNERYQALTIAAEEGKLLPDPSTKLLASNDPGETTKLFVVSRNELADLAIHWKERPEFLNDIFEARNLRPEPKSAALRKVLEAASGEEASVLTRLLVAHEAWLHHWKSWKQGQGEYPSKEEVAKWIQDKLKQDHDIELSLTKSKGLAAAISPPDHAGGNRKNMEKAKQKASMP